MWRTFRPILVVVITLGIASPTLAAGALTSPMKVIDSASTMVASKAKYPRTPIGTATSSTVERRINAAALIQGKPKTYAQGATDENKGDDTAYDLKMKLQVRKPTQ